MWSMAVGNAYIGLTANKRLSKKKGDRMGEIIFKKSGSLIERRIDGEAILLDIKSGVYYDLKDVGVFIWEILSGGSTAGKIAAAVAESFDVDAETALADTLELLKDLESEGLIVRDAES